MQGNKKTVRNAPGQKANHFMHIGKCGGSAVKEAIKENRLKGKIALHGHGGTFERILNDHPDCRIAFGVREPVSLYVSGFNSRLRKGMPRYNIPWSALEEIAFSIFQTPNALAEALSSTEPYLKQVAQFSMGSIMHVKNGLSKYLGSVKFLEANREHIAFVYELKSLREDFPLMMKALGVETVLELPTDEVSMHKSSDGLSTEISPLARANLEEWYREDYLLYEYCKQLRLEIIRGSQSGS